jgi:hypothetical protein
MSDKQPGERLLKVVDVGDGNGEYPGKMLRMMLTMATDGSGFACHIDETALRRLLAEESDETPGTERERG